MISIKEFFDLNATAIQILLGKISQLSLGYQIATGISFLLVCFLIGFITAKMFKAIDRYRYEQRKQLPNMQSILPEVKNE